MGISPLDYCPHKYVIIGGKYRCAKTKIYKKITPKRLAELYKLDPKECVFFKDENRFKNDNHRRTKMYSTRLVDDYYILRPRKHGDYKFHLAECKAAKLLEGNPI